MDFDQKILAEARRVVSTATDDARKINTHLLSMMVWHRSRLIERFLLQDAANDRIAVKDGVFKGMTMQLPIHAGIALPMILGTYESELHPHVAAAVRRGYRQIVNIGCGDGYYLVGLMRLMPEALGFGYDTNPAAQEGCRKAAIGNGVSDRVTLGGLFKGEDFALHPAGQTLVICDIEGGEDVLLNPGIYPALRGHDIIVELHDLYCPGVGERIRQRFAATHDIAFVGHQAKRAQLPASMQGLTELDEFLCVYEGRGGATPWLVMTVKPAP